MQISSILVVDEDEAVREFLAQVLVGKNFQVISTENQENALKYFQREEDATWPEVIVLGRRFQKLCHETFLRALQREAPLALEKIPVVVFPTYELEVPERGSSAKKFDTWCRLRTLTNLLAVIQGLAGKDRLLLTSKPV